MSSFSVSVLTQSRLSHHRPSSTTLPRQRGLPLAIRAGVLPGSNDATPGTQLRCDTMDENADMERVLTDETKTFGELEVRLQFVVSTTLPPGPNCTTGMGLIFDGAALLLVKNKYGWGPPGGHIEPGETQEAAMRREVQEEARVTVDAARLFGFQKIRVLNDPVPETYRYPVPSFQCFFVGHGRGPAQGGAECEDAGFFGPGSKTLQDWLEKENTQSIYDEAKEAAAALRNN